jgi:hypothetical protein
LVLFVRGTTKLYLVGKAFMSGVYCAVTIPNMTRLGGCAGAGGDGSVIVEKAWLPRPPLTRI